MELSGSPSAFSRVFTHFLAQRGSKSRAQVAAQGCQGIVRGSFLTSKHQKNTKKGDKCVQNRSEWTRGTFLGHICAQTGLMMTNFCFFFLKYWSKMAI